MKRRIIIMLFIISALTVVHSSFTTSNPENSWIRINQLGYTTNGVKVAVWCSKVESIVGSWELISTNDKKIVFSGKMGKAFGAYGPFTQTVRLCKRSISIWRLWTVYTNVPFEFLSIYKTRTLLPAMRRHKISRV